MAQVRVRLLGRHRGEGILLSRKTNLTRELHRGRFQAEVRICMFFVWS